MARVEEDTPGSKNLEDEVNTKDATTIWTGRRGPS